MTTSLSESGNEVISSCLNSIPPIQSLMIDRITESALLPLSSIEEILYYIDKVCSPIDDNYMGIEVFDSLIKKAEYYKDINDSEDTYI